MNMCTSQTRDGSSREQATEQDFIEVVPFEDVSAPRRWTLSVALPGSILDNAMHKSSELQASLACQIARAVAIFCVDEVVIFREGPRVSEEDATDALALLLRYMDTPQYLRRHLFPVSENLRQVGSLNPLNLPNHFAKDDTPRWREGVALPAGRSFGGRGRHDKPKNPNGDVLVSRYIDVGLQKLVEVDRPVPLYTRVTVDLSASGDGYAACPGKYLFGKVVPRPAPREQSGLYWGFEVRVADSLLEALRHPGIKDDADDGSSGYDLVIGTSELGASVGSYPRDSAQEKLALPEFSAGLVVFGGVHGLEHSARTDARLAQANIGTGAPGAVAVDDLFDFYINTCPKQGSRTIRTEEAIPISLATLRPYLRPRG